MKNSIIITGSSGLIGSEAVRFYCERGYSVIGIENNMREYFFGNEGSTKHISEGLQNRFKNFQEYAVDIRDRNAVFSVFEANKDRIELILHTAAQPSHDWAAREPFTDFSINANGTLVLLEASRLYAPDAVFIYTSTNKVYGDTPNSLPLVELETRWELPETHPFFSKGIDERMSIDNSKHSLFGASKLAADIMVQEYGKYFGMKTGVFRGGCLTGPQHAGAELHGFLAYLMKCAVTGAEYKIFGYQGKQVRDNIHSRDLLNAFECFRTNPVPGEVYNIGGSRHSNCSMREAISKCEVVAEKKMKTKYIEDNRIGDHIWWISDVSKFQTHFPTWNYEYDVDRILLDIFTYNKDRWLRG